MAGLEPARISPHAPQTCAYTDSATSTSNSILFSLVLTDCLCRMSSAPSHKMIFNHFTRHSATSTSKFYSFFNGTAGLLISVTQYKMTMCNSHSHFNITFLNCKYYLPISIAFKAMDFVILTKARFAS